MLCTQLLMCTCFILRYWHQDDAHTGRPVGTGQLVQPIESDNVSGMTKSFFTALRLANGELGIRSAPNEQMKELANRVYCYNELDRFMLENNNVVNSINSNVCFDVRYTFSLKGRTKHDPSTRLKRISSARFRSTALK